MLEAVELLLLGVRRTRYVFIPVETTCTQGKGTNYYTDSRTFRGAAVFMRLVDILSQKEYSYTYEEGRITRAVESDVVLNENLMIVSKTVIHTLLHIERSINSVPVARCGVFVYGQ